jgi:serine/threonine protein phosphatase PrpC
MKALYFQCAARSALGLVRNGNEDSALIGSQVIAVADGMGGHAGGEVASTVAINTLSEIAPTFTAENMDIDSASDLYLNSLHTIDAQIRAVANDEPALAGMGTTLTSLFINGSEISLLHIGDSRAYRLRGIPSSSSAPTTQFCKSYWIKALSLNQRRWCIRSDLC